MLNRVTILSDLLIPPANRLERLKRDRIGQIGQYSIRINSQWRICFEWEIRQDNFICFSCKRRL